ncbi:MAG: hypothetical protein ACOCXR_00935 [Phototrophicaceae bacterium]
MITIHAEPAAIPLLRRLVQQEYLPRMQRHRGFISAALMAHIDHADSAKMIIYWESEAAMRAAQEEGPQAGPNFNIPHVPGLAVQHEHYTMRSI